ncbi:hypothetical protein [Limibacillus halophilus]|uniref:TIGR02391 family protein n=1 Tax=Limibacillus halophilus TaxID=1579333 RepID=A0A839SYA2_9PROT|nr:hypothetical protein [Limibacillus halophilus]MBB3066005.1 hypothetical protein [Limibacillus halophilus]
MESGYVLDFSDATYGEFFASHGINIHSKKYQTHGPSKAKKMRAFWQQEPDAVVGRVLAEMVKSYEASCELDGRTIDKPILERTKAIVKRLTGKVDANRSSDSVDDFLHQEFAIPNLQRLPIEPALVPIIETRLEEARRALRGKAFLSVVIMCGSVLEAVLLAKAQSEPALFNKAISSPKAKDGKVRPFHEWTLAQFIDVASEVGVLKLDVQKFSHGLRDFRNFVHPYQQLVTGFAPDEHTANVCFQVLKAALASVAGERN